MTIQLFNTFRADEGAVSGLDETGGPGCVTDRPAIANRRDGILAEEKHAVIQYALSHLRWAAIAA